MMELLAYREGLALTSDLMLRKVRIATNYVNIVKNMRGPRMSPYGHIIREIKVDMASHRWRLSMKAGTQMVMLID